MKSFEFMKNHVDFVDTNEQKINDVLASIPIQQKIEVASPKLTMERLKGSPLSGIPDPTPIAPTGSIPTSTPSTTQVKVLRQKFSQPVHSDSSLVGGKNKTDNFKQLQKRWNRITKSS